MFYPLGQVRQNGRALAAHTSGRSHVNKLRYYGPLLVFQVWHVHMLAPVQYNKDCTAVAERMLGHQLRDLAALEKLREKTKSKWQELYPNVPFEIDLSHIKSHPEELGKDEPGVKYDIKSAALR